MLALSGGGYRAMLFHAGAILRLNDLGLLPNITEVSSVSGGTITAALLAARWRQLQFNERGVATNLDSILLPPLHRLAGKTIDGPAILAGLLTPVPAAMRIQDHYRSTIFGAATLGDMPDNPAFVFHATDLNSGRDFVFTKHRVGTASTGYTDNAHLPLALAVASSSAFPPFLSPLRVRMGAGSTAVTGVHGKPKTALLADGGVMDNLGLERAGNFDAILLSDASGRSAPDQDIRANWLSQIQRVIDLIYDQPGDLRTRALIEQYFNGTRNGTLWAIRLSLDAYNQRRDDVCPTTTQALASLPTRLHSLAIGQQKSLVNWGYISAAAALEYRFARNHSAVIRMPYPEISLCGP